MLDNIKKTNVRKNFGKFNAVLSIPYLLDIQIDSFNKFILNNNKNSGIEKVLNKFFPIINNTMNFELRYINYNLGKSIFNEQECIIRGITYAAPLKVKFNLIIYPVKTNISNDNNDNETIVKEEEVYLCDIPLMTNRGSFVINGTERVVVSQLQRSPGLFFSSEKGTPYTKLLYNARIIPARGAWLDFEFDNRDCLYFRIDRKRKIPVTVLLKSLNYSVEEILNIFFKNLRFKILNINNMFMHVIPSSLIGVKFNFDIKIKNILYIEKGSIITEKSIKLMEQYNISWISIPLNYLLGKRLAKNYISDSTGKILCFANKVLTKNLLIKLLKAKINNLEIIIDDDGGYRDKFNYLSKTLNFDTKKSDPDEVFNKHYPNYNKSGKLKYKSSFVESIFFDANIYDLSEVGRIHLNKSLNQNSNLCNSLTLTKQDIIVTLQKLIDIRNGLKKIDDLDHLGNRRIISIGEMLENRFLLSLRRIEKVMKERYFLNRNYLMPKDIINVKTISSFIKEFFTSSQLSQFMDQNNPLSEITHKRRISSLGTGGINRVRAGYEVRDVHHSHYGRICPIETPEGPNIGLINSFSLYAHVNKHGFIETPYRKVIKGIVSNDIEYLTASTADDYIICQADDKLSKNNELLEDLILCRYKGESSFFNKYDINYMDVSPQQIFSIATALIPFIDHNDANRALMGANMQRQALPLLITEKPLIGTGLERKVALDSGVILVAKRGGIVHYVDASRIVIKVDQSEITNDYSCIDIYKLTKCLRSNQNTCINQRPCVMLGEKLRRGDIIADGPSTDIGELALGKNLRVAFMSWYGYNFEDSIIISEKVIHEHKFTSIHINELICTARNTKFGFEYITADIPNVSESYISNLDESGIIAVGTEVNEGDILVGKLTPKEDVKKREITPEERLIRAIFGEKSYSVQETSLLVPNGMSGTVIDVQISYRKGIRKDKRTLLIEEEKKEYLNKELSIEFDLLLYNIFSQIKSCLQEETDLDKKAKSILDKEKASIEDIRYILKLNVQDNSDINIKINNLSINYKRLIQDFKYKRKLYEEKSKVLYDFKPGTIKIVKIYLATQKSLHPGDKIAGRHGNKGVIAKISRIEDMPYDDDGIPVDIILNPLSVPSRMNVGQLFETHLGLALKKIGDIIQQLLKENNINELRTFLNKVDELGQTKFNISSLSDEEMIILANNIKFGLPIATPAFDGVTESEIKNILNLVSLPLSGQIDLFDGCTGEKFERKITVGYMYILKLNHLVDDKIHARSTGSYSLVTQQPLGGKSQFGGQRFGEMEVWALEAYGAAYTLQEMLTVKSDDVSGRHKIYNNIVSGDHTMSPSIPESFNVLFKEIQSLCINIELVSEND